VDVNPRVPTLVLTTGGDHLMRLWDARKDSEPLFTVKHARMVRGVLVFDVHLPTVSLPWPATDCPQHAALQVPGAYFSPITGSKIVSTCTDSTCGQCLLILWTTPSIMHVHGCFSRLMDGMRVLADRIRVWESLFADMSTPTFEIIHSQDFARWAVVRDVVTGLWSRLVVRDVVTVCGHGLWSGL
jgi:hypothetical protein